MSHYFTNDQNVKTEELSFEYTYGGYRIKFNSNHGVFSKNRVDFGTNLMLKSIANAPQSILDVGCGVGVIGLSLAKAYPDTHVDLVDINERAIILTQANIKQNNIINARAFTSDLYQNITDIYDWIVSNPPIRAGKKIIYQMVEDSVHHMHIHGSLWIVIQKKQGADSMQTKMKSVFGNVEVVAKDKGYYILKSTKETK